MLGRQLARFVVKDVPEGVAPVRVDFIAVIILKFGETVNRVCATALRDGARLHLLPEPWYNQYQVTVRQGRAPPSPHRATSPSSWIVSYAQLFIQCH